MKLESNNNQTKPKGIHTGHRQRVRERFLKAGIESFQNHEVLEFLLFFGIPYKDTNALAHELIEKYGSFSAVFDAPIESLREIQGMTENAAVLLKILPKFSGLYLKDKLEQNVYLGTLQACADYLRSMLYDARKEELYVLFLDNEHKLLSYKRLGVGSIDTVTISLREIHEAILYSHASNVILAHNHPSGNNEPSTSDMRATKHVLESISYIGVNLLDHIIVTGNSHFSFRRHGLLDELKQNCTSEYITKFAEINSKWLAD